MIHPNLVRLKHYAHATDKQRYKAGRAVARLLDYELLDQPVVMLVYSVGCWHCQELMKDKIVSDKRVKSLWRRYRHILLRGGCTVIQVNAGAAPYLADAVSKAPGASKLRRIAELATQVNGVPTLYGISEVGEVREYQDARTLENLIEFMHALKN